MPPQLSVDVLLHLDAGDGTITGTLEDRHGVRRSFYGWLELSSVLDNVRSAPRGDIIPAQRPSIERADNTEELSRGRPYDTASRPEAAP